MPTILCYLEMGSRGFKIKESGISKNCTVNVFWVISSTFCREVMSMMPCSLFLESFFSLFVACCLWIQQLVEIRNLKLTTTASFLIIMGNINTKISKTQVWNFTESDWNDKNRVFMLKLKHGFYYTKWQYF